jgi:hypothetical protein
LQIVILNRLGELSRDNSVFSLVAGTKQYGVYGRDSLELRLAAINIYRGIIKLRDY